MRLSPRGSALGQRGLTQAGIVWTLIAAADLTDARPAHGRTIAGARLDRAGIAETGSVVDAGTFANSEGAGVGAGGVTDARAFGHSGRVEKAGVEAVAAVFGDGSVVVETRCDIGARALPHATLIVEARIRSLACVLGDIPGVIDAGVGVAACAQSHCAAVHRAGGETDTTILRHIARVASTRARSLAGALAHEALVGCAHADAVHGVLRNAAGVLADVAGVFQAGVLPDARV